MAIARVQKLGSTSHGSGTVTSLALTVAGTGNTTAGNTIIVAVVVHDASPTVSATDSKGNTYQLDKTQGVAGGPKASILSSKTTTGLTNNTDTITVSFSAASDFIEILAYEYSGLASGTYVDVTAGAGGSNASASSGSFTTLNANDLLFSVIGYDNAGATSAVGWTKLDEVDNFLTSSKSVVTQENIVAATAAYTATATLPTTCNWAAAAASYKAAASSPPSNTVAPAVTGTATVGSTLTTTNGTWTDDGSPTFTYQWQRDVAGNGVYGNIASATSSTYVLVSADDTCHVRCVVTDTDSIGATSANSNATAIVTFAVPVNSVAPVVSGSTTVGSTLTNDNGTWSNSPTSYGYQWTRDGVNISAATSATYTTQAADVTHAVGVKVTATNDGGTASAVASSNTISVVSAPSLSTVAGKTGTSGTAVMQKAKSGWTYITGKKNTSGTAVDQKGLGGFTKIKGH